MSDQEASAEIEAIAAQNEDIAMVLDEVEKIASQLKRATEGTLDERQFALAKLGHPLLALSKVTRAAGWLCMEALRMRKVIAEQRAEIAQLKNAQ